MFRANLTFLSRSGWESSLPFPPLATRLEVYVLLLTPALKLIANQESKLKIIYPTYKKFLSRFQKLFQFPRKIL